MNIARVWFACVVLLASSSAAHARIINADSPDGSFLGAYREGLAGVWEPDQSVAFPASWRYDADSQILSSTGNTTRSIANGAIEFDSDSLAMALQVDSHGNASGGTVAWFGTSAALGLADSSPLLLGRLVDFTYRRNSVGQIAMMEMLFEADYVDSVFGGLRYWSFQAFGYPRLPGQAFESCLEVVGCADNPFQNGSFEFTQGLTSYFYAVPEPSSLALASLGLLAVGFATRRRAPRAGTGNTAR